MVAHQRTTKAKITVNRNGTLYVGVEVTESHDLQYNDRVRITVPRQKKSDLTYTGCLNKADQISTGSRSTYEILKNVAEYKGGGSFHVEAIVEPVARTWDDENELTDRRSDGCYTLDAKL
jgi:hypothetical protein